MGFSRIRAAGRWVGLGFMLLGVFGAGVARGADTAAPIKLMGDVVGADGKPVEGAEVMVPLHVPGGMWGVVARARSGAGGRFEFEKEVPTTFESGGYTNANEVFAYVPGVGFSPRVYLTVGKAVHLALAPAVDVQITLVDKDGAPVEGVAVLPTLVGFRDTSDVSAFGPSLFLPVECSREFAAKTGADGKCVLHGMPQGGRVRPDTEDVRYARFGLINGIWLREEGPMIVGDQIRVVKAGSISGRLMVPETVKPEGGRGIDARLQGVGPVRGGNSALTNATGDYELNQLVPGTYVVALSERVDGPTEWVTEAKEVTVKEGENARMDLVMRQGGILKGQVRDAVTKKPLPGVSIVLHGPARARDAAYTRHTDAEGRYEFRVPAGSQQVTISSIFGLDGYVRPEGGGLRDVPVQEGETGEVNFDIASDAGPFVEGTVVDVDGKPLADATVTYEEPRTNRSRGGMPANGYVRTNAQGAFRFHGRPGMVVRARWQELATVAPVEVLDERPMEVKVRADANFSLVVKLVDENGGPATGGTATLLMKDAYGFNSGSPKKADAEGKVKFGPLQTDKGYLIEGQGGDYGFAQESVEKPVPGEAAVSIILPQAKFELGGMVVGGGNKPQAGVLMSMHGQKSGDKETRTDAQGRFLFHVMDEAAIQVYVGGNRELTGVAFNTRAGETDLKLEMPK